MFSCSDSDILDNNNSSQTQDVGSSNDNKGDTGISDAHIPDASVRLFDPVIFSNVQISTQGNSEPLCFSFPEEIESVMINIQSVSGQSQSFFLLQEIIQDKDQILADVKIKTFDLGPELNHWKAKTPDITQSINRGFLFGGIQTTMIPNTPRSKEIFHTHSKDFCIRVGAYTPSDILSYSPASDVVNVTAYARKAIQTTRYVDIYFALSGVTLDKEIIDAVAASQSEVIQGAIQILKQVYHAAGIEIGSVNYRDIDSKYQNVSPPGTFGSGDDAIKAASLNEESGLHFVMVNSINADLGGGGFGGGTILGAAARLPGPTHAESTAGYGVLVALGSIGADPGLLGHTMAHEGGHWLGLNHTSEIFSLPGSFAEDQFEDTPVNEKTRDGQNLMFPASSTVAANRGANLSSGQANLIRQHHEVN